MDQYFKVASKCFGRVDVKFICSYNWIDLMSSVV